MHVLSTLLFVISVNIDSFVVGLSYGMRKVKIGLVSNLIIGLITLAGTILSMLAGKIIFHSISENVSNFIGSIMLILIGSWTLIKPLLKNLHSGEILENPEKADIDNSSSIDAKESIALAFALTINNVGIGISASITGLNVVLTSALTFVFSMLTIILGYVLGSYFLPQAFNKRATIISGLIIIALGIYEILI